MTSEIAYAPRQLRSSSGGSGLTVENLETSLASLTALDLVHFDSYQRWCQRNFDYPNTLLETFHNLDDHSSGAVDRHELICALLCFCEGSKSEKLSYAFEVFSKNHDIEVEGVSKRGMWVMLRSFLVGLSAVFSFNQSANDIAVLTTSKIFAFYKNQQNITLEDLSNWYAFCGSDIAFWIELLDRKKWLSHDGHAVTCTTSNNAKQQTSQQTNATDTENNAAPSYRDILICGRVISKLAWTYQTNDIDIVSIWKTLPDRTMTREDCFQFIGSYLGMSTESLEALTDLLFHDDSDDEDAEIDSALVALALSPLFQGSKSTKLLLFFEWFAVDKSVSIDRQTLANLLTTAFRAVHFYSCRPMMALEGVDNICSEIMATNKMVSFSDLGEWYNSRGFYLVPWLELLNPEKLKK